MSDKFNYTYTALSENERREVEDIIKQYSSDKPSGKLPQRSKEENFSVLRSLNNKAHRVPRILTAIIGVCVVLVFGTGLSLIMVWGNYASGVPVSIVGLIAICFLHLIYKGIFNKNKKRYAREILDIGEALLNKDN